MLLFNTTSSCTTTRIVMGGMIIIVIIFVSNVRISISRLVPSIIIKDTIIINTNNDTTITNNSNNNYTSNESPKHHHHQPNNTDHNNSITTNNDSMYNDRNMFGLDAIFTNSTQQQQQEQQQQQLDDDDDNNKNDEQQNTVGMLGNGTRRRFNNNNNINNDTSNYNINTTNDLLQKINVNSLTMKNTRQQQQQQQKQATQQKQQPKTKICWESPCYPLRRFDNNNMMIQQPVRYSDILAGPGLVTNGTTTSSSSSSKYNKVCLFRHDIDHSNHFPHAMQQLCRCFSWWFSNGPTNNTTNDDDNDNHHYDYVLIFDPTKNIGRTSSFLQGLLRALVDAVHIQIVPNHTVPDFVYTNERFTPYMTIHPQRDFAIVRSKIITYYNITTNDYYNYYDNDNDSYNTNSTITQLESNATQQQERRTKNKKQQQNEQSATEEDAMNNITTTNATLSEQLVSLSLRQYPRIGILNRQLREQRRIMNIDTIVTALQEQNFSSSPVRVEYFNGKTFVQQVQFYANHDIIISPHGAQLTGLVFMPPSASSCSVVVEIFPESWVLPEFFGSLAVSANIRYYYFILSDPEQPQNIQKWYNSTIPGRRRRSRQLCPPVANIVTALQQIVSEWKLCIGMNRSRRNGTINDNNNNHNTNDGGGGG